jgi:hypothetical protein
MNIGFIPVVFARATYEGLVPQMDEAVADHHSHVTRVTIPLPTTSRLVPESVTKDVAPHVGSVDETVGTLEPEQEAALSEIPCSMKYRSIAGRKLLSRRQ